MKKIILVLFPILAFLAVGYIKYSQNIDLTKIENSDAKPLEFEDNKIQCPQCYMYLVGKEHTVQAIDTNHKTHFFDDPGCLILWSRDQKVDIDSLVLWVHTHDTHEYIDMRKAFFAIDEKTPMEYGFGAYKEQKEGYVDFEEFRLRMLRGEHLLNPKIRKNILGS